MHANLKVFNIIKDISIIGTGKIDLNLMIENVIWDKNGIAISVGVSVKS